MNKMRHLLLVVTLSLMAACNGSQQTEPPAPQMISEQAVGHYCGMFLSEHDGPKAQIQLKSQKEPVWFSTVLQMLGYTRLPEEPKDIAAIYVNDMNKVKDWHKPNADDSWVDAKQAYYVIDSGFVSSMKTKEAIPFSQKADAEAFAAKNGGRIVQFDDIPDSYIFQTGSMSAASQPYTLHDNQPNGHQYDSKPHSH